MFINQNNEIFFLFIKYITKLQNTKAHDIEISLALSPKTL